VAKAAKPASLGAGQQQGLIALEQTTLWKGGYDWSVYYCNYNGI